MEPRIIGQVVANNGTVHFVRYNFEDETLQISTSKIGPWFVVRDRYLLDNNALDFAKEYIDHYID